LRHHSSAAPAQGRKIIFTTNLPNVGDIDEALVRPGRCFATVRTRALERGEAEALLARLATTATTLPVGVRSITLAELYRTVEIEP
jgi:ATP-dependent 26S proteasome regulatory subunit